MIHKTVKHQVV